MDEIKQFIDNYELLIVNKKRFYLEDISERDYWLENSSPYFIRIGTYEIREGSWVEMLRNIGAYFISLYKRDVQELVDFRVSRSKAAIFSYEPRVNFKQVTSELYLNCNHSALHACWLIQDLLEFYKIDIDSVVLYIHRPSSIEPKCVKDYFLEKNYNEFSYFLQSNHGKSKEQCEKIISNINLYMNPILRKVTKSYDNFFLFDDVLTLYNYIIRFKEYVNSHVRFKEKNIKIYYRYCDYLLDFYKL
jgi:hypothetical protein